MIPRTAEEKFLHHGYVERVLRHGNIENCADPLLRINQHNDSKNKKGEVTTPWKCGNGPTPSKHKRLC